MTKIIGLDGDGVTTYYNEFTRFYGDRYFKNNIVNPNGYDVKDIYECSTIQRNKYGLLHFPKYSKECLPRAFIKEAIIQLRSEGYTIYNITGRAFTLSRNSIFRSLSRKWYEEWNEECGLVFDGIIYVSEKNSAIEKVEVCKALGITTMAEDKLENIRLLKQAGINNICVKALYNLTCSDEFPDIPMVSDGWEIYKWFKYYEENINVDENGYKRRRRRGRI